LKLKRSGCGLWYGCTRESGCSPRVESAPIPPGHTCPPEFLPAVLLAGWRISLGFIPHVETKRRFTSLRLVYPPLEDPGPRDLIAHSL